MAQFLTADVIFSLLDGAIQAIPERNFGLANREVEIYHSSVYRLGVGGSIEFEAGQGSLAGWDMIVAYAIQVLSGAAALLRVLEGSETESLGLGGAIGCTICELPYLKISQDGAAPADVTVLLFGRRS